MTPEQLRWQIAQIIQDHVYVSQGGGLVFGENEAAAAIMTRFQVSERDE